MQKYEAVIGLETHIQLNTASKIFCQCSTQGWNAAPNTHICPVCSGLPGSLPVLNRSVVEKAVLLAKAMHAVIQSVSYFDRKNYFYPDLPKGYQISQFDQPIAKGGYMDLPIPGGAIRRIRINNAHMEEDTGKTKNAGGERQVDFNRCGVPLVEMVTEPDLHSADEAGQYLTRLRQLLRWIGISEADMEKGQLRCDANVSIRLAGETILNAKTEIKNVNSIEAVKDAITHEIERQIQEMEAGRRVAAWTLEWDEDTGTLKKMRSKETEADYRYFREPDLLPVRLDDAWREQILANFPELPLERKARFITEYGLPEYDAELLTAERTLSDYFETCVKAYKGDAKRVSNWLMNDVLRMINDRGITAADLRLTPAYLAALIRLVDDGVVNAPTAKALLARVEQSGEDPAAIVAREGLAQVNDSDAIRAACREVLAESPAEVASYQAGKVTLLGWFVGQVMKKMRGKADPNQTRQALEELLK
jgi:aspartyl-tRNA(Asn)/glutamyl-tRNA(Gln) amidotransferase subunit B